MFPIIHIESTNHRYLKPLPKEGQCQRMFKLLHNCTYFTCQQGNAQNLSNQASAICELRTSRCTSWIQKRQRTRDQIASIHWIIKKAREFQKNIYFCFTDYVNCRKFLKRQEYQNILPASCKKGETYIQVRKQQLERDMEQQTGSKLGKEYVKAVYCHPAYLTSMQNTSCEMPNWTKLKLESRLQGEMSITSDVQMTPPLQQKAKRN